MKVQTWLITGASGLVGSALRRALAEKGHRVRTLSRSPQSTSIDGAFGWDPTRGWLDERALDGVDVVVHLAGASVGKRWTVQHKTDILESRTLGTTLLRNQLEKLGFGGVWIQASAVGFYGYTVDVCDESSPRGRGFLAEVVGAWEQCAMLDSPSPIRQAILRLGLVFSPQGGTLAKLWPIYRLGLGAPLGTGEQCMSWIHIDDVVRLVLWVAETPTAKGIYNATAPNCIKNRDFSISLASAVHRFHGAPAVPNWALQLFLGEMSSLLLEGQCAQPRRLMEEEFEWVFPDASGALKACASRSK